MEKRKTNLFGGIASPFIQAAAISLGVMLFICPLSCKMTPEGVSVITAESSSPVIEKYTVTGNDCAEILFSKKISLKSCEISPDIGVMETSVSENDSGACILSCKFFQNMEAGKVYSFAGKVEDDGGNSLTFEIPFKGYNSRVPKIEITEFNPKYASSKNSQGISSYKCEFVELLVKTDGNLAGIQLISAFDGDDKKYEFPVMEVKAGDVITVHLRSKGDGCVSELGNNLEESFAVFSNSSARDLWSDNTEARLNDECDVIFLKNSCNDTFLDAVCYALSSCTSWKSESVENAVKLAVEQALWTSQSIEEAVNADGITASKSLIKSGFENCKGSWKLKENTKLNTAGSVDR